jgi:hypothetical protein
MDSERTGAAGVGQETELFEKAGGFARLHPGFGARGGISNAGDGGSPSARCLELVPEWAPPWAYPSTWAWALDVGVVGDGDGDVAVGAARVPD